MKSIMSNGTWEVVDHPYGCQPIDCKWIFKKKLRPDGKSRGTRQGLWPKDIPKKRVKISLIPTHQWLD
jgi:hypothetical protein